jgi:hypothetical protein
MKLYRCWTCGIILVNDQDMKKHAGHQFRNPGMIHWYEYPKIFIWEVKAWLKKRS